MISYLRNVEMRTIRRALISPRNLLGLAILVGIITVSCISVGSTGRTSEGVLGPAQPKILYNATSSELTGLEGYFTNLYNPSIGMIAVGTSKACVSGGCGGVTFNFQNGSAAPIFPTYDRYLPFENWKDAYGFVGLGVDSSIATNVLASISSLKTTVGWHPPWNAESMIGFIIPYSKSNTNIVFLHNGQYLEMPDGTPYQIDQAAAWSTSSQSWLPPDMNTNHALNCGEIDECLFQAVNLYMRGDSSDAMNNLQTIANEAVKNPDGSIGFGTAPYRGMYLGTFVEAAEVIGVPTLPNGITMNDVVNTIWGLQATQNDGGVPRQYSSFTSGLLGSDDETTNAALLAFSPGVIEFIEQEAASGMYNLNSVPSASPNVVAILGSTTSSSSSSSFTTTTSSTTTSTTTFSNHSSSTTTTSTTRSTTSSTTSHSSSSSSSTRSSSSTLRSSTTTSSSSSETTSSSTETSTKSSSTESNSSSSQSSSTSTVTLSSSSTRDSSSSTSSSSISTSESLTSSHLVPSASSITDTSTVVTCGSGQCSGNENGSSNGNAHPAPSILQALGLGPAPSEKAAVSVATFYAELSSISLFGVGIFVLRHAVTRVGPFWLRR